MKRIVFLAWVVLLGVLVIAESAPAGQNGNGAPTGEQALTPEEEANLAFLREEEKLARDVYLYLFARWGKKIFANISESEQQHMDAVKNFLDKYGQEDPAEGNGLGEFADPDLQDLYNYLIDQGILSKLDALEVGVIIEETDIEDLQDIIDETEKPDIKKVCGNLLNGSRNHLEAFEREIELMEDTFEL